MAEPIVASDTILDELEASRTFETSYQAEARTLFRRLWLVTGNRAEAKELMQDAFLKAWERWDRVGGSGRSLVASRCCVADGGGPVWLPDGSGIAFE
jgi:DNA-directed RNA polymerase specialized sigma24 family protein